MRWLSFSSQPAHWSILSKLLLSMGLSLGVIGFQFLVARDYPIHFAPALAAVCVSTWCFGLLCGIFAQASAALAVNYLLLSPQTSWSIQRPDVLATASFLLLGALALAATASLRNAINRLERELERATSAAQIESSQRKEAESEFHAKMALFDHEIAGLRKYVDSYERSKKFARKAQVRLAELRAAIEEFPMPIALIANEDGLPVIHLASSTFFEFANQTQSSAILDALESILTTSAQPFASAQHPLMRAMRGETIAGEKVMLLGPAQPQEARLFIKPVVDGRYLAVAIVAGRRIVSGAPN